MRSSSNSYLSNLDHLRAFAAFMVFIWHFTHYSASCPQSHCEGQYHLRLPFFSLLEQGYSGVALFMCISGYIFTYLTDGHRLHIGKFWFNRILRLFPLIIFWGISESLGLIENFTPASMPQLLHKILHPQGAWTIYIELQYYLLLPLILICVRKFGTKILVVFLLALVASRLIIWTSAGSVQDVSYWTILGRADQFLLGTMAFHLEKWIKTSSPNKKHIFNILGLSGLAGIITLYHIIHLQGGFHEYGGTPSGDMLWVFQPTLEGLCYSLIIICYLQYRIPKMLDRTLSALGKWSYSIYLDHFQLLPFLVVLAVTRFGMPEDFYGKLGIATFIIFPLLSLFGAATYGLIEKPFLRLRKNYLLPPAQTP